MTTDLHTLDLAEFAFTRQAWVAAPPATVYDLVSDVSTIERWSPSASAVAYDDGDGPRVGARFSGLNRRDGREWTTRSQVVTADPAAEFAFVVDGIVSWRWTFRADGGGTVVAQSWRLLRTDPVLGLRPRRPGRAARPHDRQRRVHPPRAGPVDRGSALTGKPEAGGVPRALQWRQRVDGDK